MIYIRKGEENIGPLTLEQVKQGIIDSRFAYGDWAFHKEIGTWKPLQEVLVYSKNHSATGKSNQNVQSVAVALSKRVTQAKTPPVPSDTHESTADAVESTVTVTSPSRARDMLHKFLNEEQDPEAVGKVYDRLGDICVAGETILYIAVQKKPVVTIAPTSVVVTTKRLLVFRPKAMGMGLTFEDYIWRNVHDLHISEALLGASFYITLVNGYKTMVDYLPKAQARKLYQFGQQMEEAMHHQRRDLMLEEKRAAAGNVNVAVDVKGPNIGGPQLGSLGSEAALPESGKSSSGDDLVQRLQKLKTMLDHGLITQDDYDAKKGEIVGQL